MISWNCQFDAIWNQSGKSFNNGLSKSSWFVGDCLHGEPMWDDLAHRGRHHSLVLGLLNCIVGKAS